MSFYLVKRRDRYKGLTCGIWGRWHTFSRYATLDAARLNLPDMPKRTGREYSVWHKGKKL